MLPKVRLSLTFQSFAGTVELTRLEISSFSADPWGACSSIVSTYSIPSEYCQRVVGDGAGGDFVNTTLSIWGTTVTGSAFTITGSGRITTETVPVETPVQDYVGVSVVAMLYLVHEATETAGGSGASSTSSPASAASVNARGPQLASVALIISTMAVAFTSGFMFLIA